MKILQLKCAERIVIKTIQGARFLSINQILFVNADSNYSRIILLNQEELLVSTTLKYIENQLQEFDFIRCHKSYLVNLAYVNKLYCNGINMLKLSTDHEIPVSREGIKRLKDIVGM